MSNRTDDIARIFGQFLERYTPPLMMKDKPEVIQAEFDVLLGVVLKFAPRDGYDDWMRRMTYQLGEVMKTRSWPTQHEVGATCSNVRKEAARSGNFTPPPERTEVQIMADRMNAGEVVGDGFLYGRQAVEIEKSGLVSRETMRKYRSALFFAMKDAWPGDMARDREAALIKKHEDAENLHRAGNIEMPKGEPFKRMPKDEWEDVA